MATKYMTLDNVNPKPQPKQTVFTHVVVLTLEIDTTDDKPK